MNKFQPIANRVLIKPLPKEEKTTSGGIVIPTTVKEQVSKAVVFSRGEDCKVVKENDTVLYTEGVGIPITMNEENYLLVFEHPDCLAVI